MFIVAIDIGASSGRHILGEYKDHKLSLTEIYRFKNTIEKEAQGNLVWNIDYLFEQILEGLKICKKIGKIPKVVGIDTWAVDYVLLDEDDQRLQEAYSYRDKRTTKAVNEVHKLIPFSTLFSKTGIQFQQFNTIYQLQADKMSGKLAKAKTLLMLPDYFNYLLTGIKKQEYTNATSMALINASTHTYDTEILEKLDLSKSLFLPLTQPGQIIGDLKDEIAEILGYQTKIALVASHDTASAVIAMPLKENEAYLSTGTWSLLGNEQKIAHCDNKAMKYNFSNEGGLNCTYRLQKNIMGLWIIQRVKEECGEDISWCKLVELARKNKTDKTIDVNNSKFFSPNSMIKAIEEDIGPSSLGQLTYAVYNSLALSYAKSLLELEELLGKEVDSLFVIGGGTKNSLLTELTSFYTKKKLRFGVGEGSAVGNIILQLMAEGEVKDLEEGRKLIAESFPIKEVNTYENTL